MRREYEPHHFGGEEPNFSKRIERADRMASEETKIMTFKSQDNGFAPSAGHDESHQF